MSASESRKVHPAVDCCQVETSSLDFFLLPRLAGDRDLCPRLLCPRVTALLSLDGCCDGYGPDVEWVPSTREKLSALVQDLVQTQLFLCTPSWNHLAHFFFFFLWISIWELKINPKDKEWELECAKFSQQVQIQSICPNSSLLAAPQIPARRFKSNHHVGPISNRQKPISVQTLSNQNFTFLTVINCSLRTPNWYGKVKLCGKRSSYYCKNFTFCLKKKNESKQLIFLFFFFLHFNILPVTAGG